MVEMAVWWLCWWWFDFFFFFFFLPRAVLGYGCGCVGGGHMKFVAVGYGCHMKVVAGGVCGCDNCVW